MKAAWSKLSTFDKLALVTGVVLVLAVAGALLTYEEPTDPQAERSPSGSSSEQVEGSGLFDTVPQQSNGTLTGTSRWFTDWFGNGVVGHSLTEKRVGAGSAFVTTSTDGLQASFLRSFDAQNLSADTLKVWVKADTWADLVNAQVRLHTDDEAFFFANIRNRVAGAALPDAEWVEVHLPRSAFEEVGAPTWETITSLSFVAWSPLGQSATVWFNHVTKHPDGQGVVSLTFDDSWASQYDAAAIMDEFGYVGTAYTIHTLLGTPGHLTAAQVDDLHDRGWDISGHDDAPLTSLSDEALEANLAENAAWLRGEGYRGAGHYAYPNGSVDARVEAAVRRHFSTARTINPANQPTGYLNPHRLNSVNVFSIQPDAEIEALVDAAVANGEWLILTFHKVDASGDELAWTPQRFRDLLQHIKDAGAVVEPVGGIL